MMERGAGYASPSFLSKYTALTEPKYKISCISMEVCLQYLEVRQKIFKSPLPAACRAGRKGRLF
jgi:hypothetical protein